MRHRKQGRKFNIDSSHRSAMFRNMVTSLMLHGQIRTTTERAKELSRFAEKVITFGKKAPAVDGLKGDALKQAQADRVHLIRQARKWVNNDEALGKVFGEYAERFANRSGGYTRVIKADVRPGDNADMAFILLTEALEAKPVVKAKTKKAAAPKADEPKAEEPAAEEASSDEASEE